MFKDILLGLVVCAIFFALVEVILRVAGVPARDPADDPFVGFAGTKPLYAVTSGVASTAAAKLRFFNEASFAVEKPANTTRVFCFGESTTYGHPFDGRTAFPRWLQDLLQASSPEKKFEVINAGGISYASYRIVRVVQECLQYHPDLMVIYMGHNEFLERRTYRGLFEQGQTLVTVRSLLEESNTYQGLKRLMEPLLLYVAKSPESAPLDVSTGGKPRGNRGGPPRSVMDEEVSAVLDHSAGLDLYHRDEEFSRGVVTHFAHNLRATIRLCRDAGVPVIVVDPPSNLRDFSPFKSEHGTEMSAAEKSRLDERLQAAVRLVGKGDWTGALDTLDQCIQQDPLYAACYYWKGKALLGLGRKAEAREQFVKAKDLDVCPLRCISPINAEIVKIAHEERAMLVPFREILDRKVSETGDRSGIPGNESFLDHVHPTIAMHQVVAELILDQMIEHSLVKPSGTLTSQDRTKLYTRGMASLDKRFFLIRDLNLAKTLKWAGRKEEARAALERVAAPLDDNPEIHKMMGSFLLEEGKHRKAVEEYRKAVKLSGDDPQMIFCLAVAYGQAGLKDEALECYRKLVYEDKSIPDAFANLAVLLLEAGKVNEALDVLSAGLKAHPESSVLFGPYGLSLAMAGKVSEAIPWTLRAVEAEPGDAKQLYNLAGMYALERKPADALRYLDMAVQRGYANADMLARDPVFATVRDNTAFKQILDRIR
ncbi:MAG: tetratricopeptide repeat protein [Desulfomonile tiedjei]|nr:tetratricopeptide repeat protein [Desulfomonile tiedjei]